MRLTDQPECSILRWCHHRSISNHIKKLGSGNVFDIEKINELCEMICDIAILHWIKIQLIIVPLMAFRSPVICYMLKVKINCLRQEKVWETADNVFLFSQFANLRVNNCLFAACFVDPDIIESERSFSLSSYQARFIS